jgi:SAM-dependent methyltransferase
MCRELHELGHRVLALDGSFVLSRLALDGGGISLAVQADAAELPIGDGVADLVVAFMSLQDIDDASSAVREAARVLRPAGRLCAAITHPVSSAGAYAADSAGGCYVIGRDYFEPRRQTYVISYAGGQVALPHCHRSLSDYFEMLAASGLLIEVVRELPGGDAARGARVPGVLHLRAVKMETA